MGSYLDHPAERNPNRDLAASTDPAFPLDLTLAPFLLQRPLRVYNEHTSEVTTRGSGPAQQQEPDKFLLLYSINYLRTVDFDVMRAMAAL